ncbi:MAG: VIT1/CCC1 transporter family protein [Candidatus Micrarchaeota archaeon]
MDKTLDKRERSAAVRSQKDEITSYHVYSRLARITKDAKNRKLLHEMAKDELKHYGFWKGVTGKEMGPDMLQVSFYEWVSRLLGLTFGCKLLESSEEDAQEIYASFQKRFPEMKDVIADEEKHEKLLIGMIEEETLRYVGSIVLGLNDALVELTGVLAGLSFAFQNNSLIAVTGLITGIAASLSMAASEYLSKRSEDHSNPLRSSFYTGAAYICTVTLLITPFFLFGHYLLALAGSLLVALTIIFAFNFYIAVAKGYDFKRRFLEMAAISLGVSAISLGIGVLVKTCFGLEV